MAVVDWPWWIGRGGLAVQGMCFRFRWSSRELIGSETESVVSLPMASTTRGVTRVLILADAPVLRRGLIGMVNETAGLQAVGPPGEPRRALTLAETARPDAVVVELGAGLAATLNACRDLRRRFPQLAIVAVATSESPAVVNEALAAGV